VVEGAGPFRLDTAALLDFDATLGVTPDDCEEAGEAEEEGDAPPAATAEELLFLVLDVFKCIGPVLDLMAFAAAAAEGSILSADLALATMPVLMEPDFIVLFGFSAVSGGVLLGFAAVSGGVFSNDCAAGRTVVVDAFAAVAVDAFGVWIGLTSVTLATAAASALTTASMLTAAGMSACDELRLEFRLDER